MPTGAADLSVRGRFPIMCSWSVSGDSNPVGFRLPGDGSHPLFTPTGELTVKLANIEAVQDLRLYALFPAFALACGRKPWKSPLIDLPD